MAIKKSEVPHPSEKSATLKKKEALLIKPDFFFAGPTVVLVCNKKKKLLPIFSFLEKQSELLFLSCFSDGLLLDTLDLKKLASLRAFGGNNQDEVFAQFLNYLQKGILQAIYPAEKQLNEAVRVLHQSNVDLLTILKRPKP